MGFALLNPSYALAWIARGVNLAACQRIVPSNGVRTMFFRYATWALSLLCTLSVAGCGVQRAFSANDARQRYEQSAAGYRDCLTENSSNVRACEAKRLVMETDERQYHNLRDNSSESIVIRSR